MRNYLPGVEWFGKSFTVQSIDGPKQRLYTTVLCYTEQNKKIRLICSEYIENNSINIDFSSINLKKHTDLLPLVIKKYDTPGAFSAVLHESLSTSFSVMGPHGKGLQLNANSTGSYVIFVGGTGVLPFLDLFDFLLRKGVNTLIS